MSHTPPPYSGPVTRKSTNPLVWVFVALGAFCCIAIIGFGAMGYGVYNGTKDMLPCLFTSDLLGRSMNEYVKEKGKFPPTANWQTEIAPYYEKAATDFKADMGNAPGPLKQWGNVADINQPLACNKKGTETFLIYNSEVAGKKIEDVDADTTALIFEDDKGGSMNEARKFERKPFGTSPKLMGSPRGWYVLLANGKMEVVDDKGKRQVVNLETGT